MHIEDRRQNAQRVAVREAGPEDIAALQEFIFAHGQNQWNFLPDGPIREHLAGIASRATAAVMAEERGRLVGFISFLVGDYYPQYEAPADRGKPRGYVAEAVVHRECAGQGIGSRLLEEAKARLHARGIDTIYIHRHADNEASGGMMRKAGFVEVDRYLDPEHRATGSQTTAVSRFRFERERD